MGKFRSNLEYVKYFKVLEIPVNSTQIEIKKAYKWLIKQWHPDKFPNDKTKLLEATEKSVELNAAFENLKNYIASEKKDSYVHKTNKTSSGSRKGKRHNITRIRVKSSNIFSIGYDNLLKILQIEFRNGSVYDYYEVPSQVFDELMEADSKGKFAHRFIYSHYKYSCV